MKKVQEEYLDTTISQTVHETEFNLIMLRFEYYTLKTLLASTASTHSRYIVQLELIMFKFSQKKQKMTHHLSTNHISKHLLYFHMQSEAQGQSKCPTHKGIEEVKLVQKWQPFQKVATFKLAGNIESDTTQSGTTERDRTRKGGIRSSSTTKIKCNPEIPLANQDCLVNDQGQVVLFNYISQKIDNNQTYDCDFAHFHIANLYLQAERLTFFSKHHKQSIGYLLFQASIKKLNKLNKVKPLQVEEQVFYDVISDCLKYYKHKLQEGYYSKKLKQFIDKHQTVMNNFMPLFLAYFRIVAQFKIIFNKKPSLSEVMAYVTKIEREVRQKYNNFGI